MMTTKKIVALLLAMVMLIGAIPAGVYAKTVDCGHTEHTHDDACYKLMCETTEHEHKACDLSCEIEAHTHCHPLTCDIKEHKHNACDLSCELDAHAHCYAFVCELDEHVHDDDACYTYNYVAQVGEVKYESLQEAVDAGAAVKLIADVALDDAVVVAKDVTIDLNGFAVVSAGDAFEVKTGTLTINGNGSVTGGANGVGSWTAIWANGGNAILNGGTYSVGGDSSTADVTHQNDVIYTKNGGTVVVNGGTFLNDGTVWTLNENDANRGTIVVYGGTFQGWNPADNVSEGANTNFVAEGYESVKNGDNYVVSKIVETPVEPEEPATPDVDPDARCGKYEHEHKACDLSCKLYAHTHCNGDTCEIEEHKHTACDLSCDKVEHIHCYPATETPDEPEVPETPEVPKEPATPEIDPNALCGKYEHKHTACDLSCKLYEHTHCHGDTCEKVEHEHKACDLSCKLEAHTHCYPATEVEEEVKLLNGMDITVTAPVLGAEVNRDYELDVDGDVEFTDIYIDWFFNAKTHDVDDENWEVVKGKYEADVYHALLMEFTMDNAELAEDAVITVNGEEALIIPNGANTFNVIYIFLPLTDEEIEDGGDDKDPTVEGYEFVCELEEHKHVACDLSCKIPEHTHCFSDKCDKVAHKHNACDLSCKLEEHEHCYIAEKSDEDEGDEEAVVLNKVTITIEAPAIGEKFAESIALVTDPANLVALSDVELFWFAQGETEDEWLLLEKDDVAEAGVVYGVDICIPVDGFELNKDLIATINGKEALVSPIEDDLYIGFIFEAIADEDEGDDEEVTAPTIIDGANGEWKDNSKDGLTFRSNADFADFLSVKVDGAEIEAKNYEAKEGSTIVALKNEYLKTLKAGEHTLAVVSKNGEATTKFTITHVHDIKKVEAKAATCTEKGVKEHYECACGKWFSDEKGATEIIDKTSLDIAAAGHKAADTWTISGTHHWKKCTVCKEPAADKIAHDFDETGKICKTCKYDTDNPKTGSESPVGMIVAIMVVSVLGMSAIAGYYVWDKKRK